MINRLNNNQYEQKVNTGKTQPLSAIKRYGRWRNINMVVEYIEEGRQFEESVATALRGFE